MRVRRSGAALWPVLSALALLGAGAVVLLQQGALMVHQCVTAGSLGRFGVTLALLREDAACPSGYGVGDGQRAIGVVVAIALPVLLAHLVGAGVGVGLASRLHRLVRVAVGVVRSLRPRPAEPVALPVPRLVAVDVPVVAPRSRAVAGGPWWRGPPEVGLA
ncbi:hypothetical protein AFE02nite_17020 [Actinotalea fermentans]|uniref:Uncharacterized protein n=2 Tax=Actinotalea fermentans TaxID=43671 RepID=A0A511YXP2_9CELL|nr:hypothetical protein AFE02nite_17020 [Actinotalea fermentans]